jgi:predicted phage terminase large subunit-like protein
LRDISEINKKLDEMDTKISGLKREKRQKHPKRIKASGIYENSVVTKERFMKCLKNSFNSNALSDVLDQTRFDLDAEELWRKYQRTVLDNPYIMFKPLIGAGGRSPQLEFLLCEDMEVFYGGSGGGGKSVAMLAGALQYVDCPGYAALLLRRTLTDSSLPDALLSLAHNWLDGTKARFDSKNNCFVFPSGAVVVFGYCKNEGDEQRYRSAQFQYVGVDELTEWNEKQYLFLFSRLRRPKRSSVPLRMRCASNPGGIGHNWVKQRFVKIVKVVEDRVFIPAKLVDNPEIDQEGYRKSLMNLDPVRRAQILEGNWDINPEGRKFQRDWFKIVKDYPKGGRVVRYWDKAATEPKKGKDPDYTVGVKATMADGEYYVLDVVRFRGTPKVNETRIGETAVRDGKEVEIFMEQEPGSAGVNDIDNYARRVLSGFCFKGEKTTGSKEIRANPLSSLAQGGYVLLVEAPWNSDFLDEMEMFPDGDHDDIVDATSGALSKLTEHPPLGGGGVPSIFGNR